MISIPNKLLTRLPVLLAQIEPESNSNKLKSKMKRMLHLLYQQSKITKTFNQVVIIIGTKFACNKRIQTFIFILIGLKMLTRI